ncbi:hypothetical protein D3C83_16230 [compost metagenome]
MIAFWTSAGRLFHLASFIDTWKVVVPKRMRFGPSIWKSVTSWILSGGMISQGMNAPSTTFFDSACGRSGTGMPTGAAPSASMIQAPVRVGMRIFRPFRSSGLRTSLSAMWIAWPACTCRNITLTSLKSSAMSPLRSMSRIARLVAVALLVWMKGSSNTSERGNRLAV